LTEEQKADMRKLFEQRLAVMMDVLQNYVKSGQMTQEQADARLSWMKDRFELGLKYAGAPRGQGMGRGMGGGPRF